MLAVLSLLTNTALRAPSRSFAFMHDPSDDTQDEEDRTTTLAANDAKDAHENGKNEDEGDAMDTEDFSTTEPSAKAANADGKPQAIGDDDNDDKDNTDDGNGDDDEIPDDLEDYPLDNTYEGAKNENETKRTDQLRTNTAGSVKNSNDTVTAINAKSGNGSNGRHSNITSSSAGPASVAPPPPPVLKGTLSFNIETRRHMIRGMWNYENSSTFPPQRFELLRNLDKDEDPTVLPSDGEFHGSFSLAYFHTTSKGKQKERSKVIPESGVKITFTPIQGNDGEFDVDGEGTNQFGIFNINGKATPSEHEGDPTFDIVLRKRYKPSNSPAPAAALVTGDMKKKKRTSNFIGDGSLADVESVVEPEAGPLPPPSESFPSRVVCLRGKLMRDQSDELGVNEGIYRINGMWSSGLDLILADPQNVRGLCNRFEYEHKSSQNSNVFPVSGRYSGWFDLTSEDGSRTRINEKDITLKFRKNNAGYHNVEGKGSNAFGKYSITGTLTLDNVITIFRHFQAPKKKAKDSSAKPDGTTISSSHGAPIAVRDVAPPPDMKLKLDDVEIPRSEQVNGSLPIVPPPPHGTYSAVSRGIMRLNEDGSHTCAGKWAMTREHFNNGTVSNFAFRLEAHFAAQGAAAMKKANGEDPDEDDPAGVSLLGAPPGSLTFPVDSALYKGSFQMKRGATKYTSVIDQQIVLKFRKNSEGSFNVHGTGINSIGVFTLVGKLILSGKSSGHVELYRMYPLPPAAPGHPEPAVVPTNIQSTPSLPPPPSPPQKIGGDKAAHASSAVLPSGPAPSRPGLLRRESSRLVKLPSRLEDDDPDAQLGRLLEKCGQLLKFISEKDVASGAFFANPVDPVALGLPTYYQIISEPMDLGTIQSKLDSDEIETPEEFGRLVRLVFENAMTFNVEPTHIVHQSARQLLILFNQKFRDIERMAENIRRQHKLPDTVVKTDPMGGGKQLGKSKKRKGGPEELMSAKRRRLIEAQAMAAENASAMSAIVAAAPQGLTAGGSVSRAEFNAMLQMIQKLQGQVVQTYTALAEMSSDAIEEPPVLAQMAPPHPVEPQAYAPAQQEEYHAPVQEKKKAVPKRKEPSPLDDEKPLTFEEQQAMTDAINRLPSDKIAGVVKIIRESANVDDDDTLEMDVDQLDTVTQRKLQRFVMKVSMIRRVLLILMVQRLLTSFRIQQFVKPPRKKPKLVPKKNPPVKKPEAAPMPAVPKKPQHTVTSKPPEHGFFAFGSKGGESDSDSEDGEIHQTEVASSERNKDDDFNLGDAHDDDDDNDDIGNNGFGTNWSMATSEPAGAAAAKDADDDDWGAAREQAEVAKVRAAERKAREDKVLAEAELAKSQRLAVAAARGEEARAQRDLEAAKEARLREQNEKAALERKRAARDAERAKLQSVERTVNLDEQRDIMKQFETNFMGDEADGASPSSDYGF
jgi:hypothetical protein